MSEVRFFLISWQMARARVAFRTFFCCHTTARNAQIMMTRALVSSIRLLLGAAVGSFALAGPAQTQPLLSGRVEAGMPAVLMAGAPGTSWTLQFSTNLGSPPTWFPLATLTLSNTPSLVVDYPGAGAGRRFYRAVSHPVPTGIVASNMVYLGPATFLMGSPSNEVDRAGNETLHPVTLTRGFFIAKYPVTQAEYQSVTGGNPSYFNGVRGATDYGTDLNRPVESVYWFLAGYYCEALTQRERQAGRIPANWSYRLPTEAEWEYACRAGLPTRFSYGDDPGYVSLGNYAWYSANSNGRTHAVGQKWPNPFGLHDLHGNVYEWVQDLYGNYPTGWVFDPQGPDSGYNRVFRSGAWSAVGKFCRAASRSSADPGIPYNYIGFRVVLAPQP